MASTEISEVEIKFCVRKLIESGYFQKLKNGKLVFTEKGYKEAMTLMIKYAWMQIHIEVCEDID